MFRRQLKRKEYAQRRDEQCPVCNGPRFRVRAHSDGREPLEPMRARAPGWH